MGLKKSAFRKSGSWITWSAKPRCDGCGEFECERAAFVIGGNLSRNVCLCRDCLLQTVLTLTAELEDPDGEADLERRLAAWGKTP